MFVGNDFQIRIGDFGFAKDVTGVNADSGVVTNSVLGTPGYMAPEIVERRDYSGISVDIYAFGVVLFSMLTGSAPFQGVSSVTEGATVVQQDKLYELLLKDKAAFFKRYEK